MNLRRINLTCLLVTLACSLSSGCGQAAKQAAQAEKNDLAQLELRQLVVGYHRFCDIHEKAPPKGLAEFEEATAQTGVSPSVLQKIRDGEYIVAWDTPIYSYSHDQRHVMPLAFQSSASKSGGAVATGDGTVSVMTAEEFAAAPKFDKVPPQNPAAQANAKTPNASPASAKSQAASLGAYDGPAAVPSTDRPVTMATVVYPGMIVQARDTGGWYAADVLEVLADGKIKVHYRGWGATSVKTLPRSDVQLAPDEVPQPPKR